MNRKTGTFTRYSVNKDNVIPWQNVVVSIFQDRTNKLWVGTWNGGGINLFDSVTKTFKKYIEGDNISSIYEDKDGVLWIAGSALYKYNRNADNFIIYRYPVTFTAISNPISIIEDNQKQLWLSTSDGIVRINPQRDETTVLGKNYGVAETNGLFFSFSYKGRNGQLYFSKESGYYLFDPAKITQNIKPAEIIFTGFSLANQLVKPDNKSPLKLSLSKTKEIQLPYNQNIFSFDFAAVDYSAPEDNRLFFMLENYENNWQQANSEQRAYYFNINPGKYVFRVKAVNGYGIWSEKKITIIISPPWWKTWWAYSLYALLFISVIIGFDRFQRHRIVLAERQKNEKRELAQAKEIEKAYTELKATQSQLIQSEKMASLGELTAGIAHEIQNPLNFINNFSEVNKELLAEMKEELDKGNLDEVKALADDVIGNEDKINHHGKRADAIVKNMLQHSRTSSAAKEPTDINALADEYLRLSYHGLRAKDKLFNATMKTDFDDSIGKINVIPQDIGRVILNLITNAFYAVNEKKQLQIEGYEPTVSVSTKKLGNKVEIIVSDNGNGIPPKVLEKIFQPFFTTKPSGKGTGLGLSLSYDIVTKGHKGELKVETNEGEFTNFIIILTA